jgi:hypothetical protein
MFLAYNLINRSEVIMARRLVPKKKAKISIKVKKEPVGKTVKSVSKGNDAALEALGKELRTLIPKLDVEGLAFLVKQARVHLYNMQVDELNKAAQEANLSAERSKILADKTKKAGAGKKDALRIVGNESGTSFFIYYGNENAIFSKNEMTHLVKMVHAGGTELEICERLYSWFRRERYDLFSFIPMANQFDSRLKTIVAIIKKNFTVK